MHVEHRCSYCDESVVICASVNRTVPYDVHLGHKQEPIDCAVFRRQHAKVTGRFLNREGAIGAISRKNNAVLTHKGRNGTGSRCLHTSVCNDRPSQTSVAGFFAIRAVGDPWLSNGGIFTLERRERVHCLVRQTFLFLLQPNLGRQRCCGTPPARGCSPRLISKSGVAALAFMWHWPLFWRARFFARVASKSKPPIE